VVGDVRQYRLDVDASASVYFSLSQVPLRVTDLMVRTTSDPLAMASRVTATVHRLDPAQAVAETGTLDQARRDLIRPPRLTTTFVAIFAGLALLITLVGLSGSLGLSVERRSRELGLRLALGAPPSNVFLGVMRQGAMLLAGGLLLGFPAAFALSTVLSSLLFQVDPHDPETFSLVGLFLLLASFTACLIPARRAISIDPLESLRVDGD
jgi:ABC-type antimicrobial peptide transport system permease subunit